MVMGDIWREGTGQERGAEEEWRGGREAMRMNGNLQVMGAGEVGGTSRKRQRPEIGEVPKNQWE